MPVDLILLMILCIVIGAGLHKMWGKSILINDLITKEENKQLKEVVEQKKRELKRMTHLLRDYKQSTWMWRDKYEKEKK